MSHTPYHREALSAIERAEKKAAEIAHPADRNAFLVGCLRAELIALSTRAQLASQHDNIAERIARDRISVEDAGEIVVAVGVALKNSYDDEQPGFLQLVLDRLQETDDAITLLYQEVEEGREYAPDEMDLARDEREEERRAA